MYKSFLKRVIDFSLSFIGLILVSPLLLLITILLIIVNRGNPFFVQIRPGKDAKPFNLIKFKTMTDEKDEQGELLPDKKRITKFGSFLREYSLDELPQLINVLKGDMSLVGPRPLRLYYLPLYNKEQKRRHNVRPGITGWAQVNGRNALTWEDKFKLDVWYVDNLSLLLDLKIILKTIFKVFKRENVFTLEGNFTEPFRGTGEKMVSVKEIQELRRKENSL